MTLLEALISRYPTAKRTTLREMIRERRVLVDGTPASSAKLDVDPAQTIRVLHQQGRGGGATRLPFVILHEDADLIVIDKPHGLITQSGPRDRRPTLIGMLQALIAGRDGPSARVRLVHRLDADAAGVIVFAKANAAQQALKRQFADHSAERLYLALVTGKPPRTGRIASRLVELADGRVRTTPRPDRGDMAVTHFQRLGTDGKVSLLRVRLETGRKHQIRAHLSEEGWPIIGDRLYGRTDMADVLRLVAIELSLNHPRTGRRVTFKRPWPAWTDPFVSSLA